MSSVRPPVKKFDKILLASKLKAYQEGPEIPNTSNSWCYGLKVQGNNQQMPIIAFKGVGEITVPVSNKNLEKLKQSSQHLNNGLWEMPLHFNNLDPDNPNMNKFLKATIPMMTKLALRQLKINPENIQGLEVRKQKLTIMESGANKQFVESAQSSVTKSPGVFATMIVQFPIESGHKGGSVVVNRGHQSRTFENARDSCRFFHYTVFLSDCSCQIEELTAGRRLAMTFDIACSDPSNLFPTISTAKEVTDLLQHFSPSDRLLAIPLKEGETTFSSLSSDARNLVGLFNSVNLEVRLAIISHYRVGVAKQRTGCECCLKRRCPCQEVIMAQVNQEKISTIKWLDPFDRELKLDLYIDPKNDIVGDGPLFFENPSEEKINLQTWVLEQWYNRPVLVALHKAQPVQLDCLHEFDTVLYNLERQAGSPKERDGILRSVQEVVSFSCENPEVASKAEDSNYRLLMLCIQLKDSKEIIRVMEIIAANQGVSSPTMSGVLGDAMQLIGPDASTPLIAKLISLARAQDQMRHYVQLAITLLDRDCHEAAVATASHICKILSSDGIISSLEISVLAFCVDLLVRLDDNPLTCLPQRLINLCGQIKVNLSSFLPLLQLLGFVQDCLNARPAERIPISAINWYYELSLHLAQLDIPPDTTSEQMLSGVKLFVSCGDSTLMDAFVQLLTNNRNQSNKILKNLLALEDTWKLVDESADGKRVVSSLVDKRISWLGAIPKPEPSWAFPNAVVVGHPLVEDFMRSNKQSMTYTNFNNLGHARNWARKHFGCSQIAEAHPAGAGSRVYCEVVKIRQCENGSQKPLVQQKELMGLIDKRLQVLGDAPCSVVVDFYTKKVSFLEILPDGSTSANQSISHPSTSSSPANVVPQMDPKKTGDTQVYVLVKDAHGQCVMKPATESPTTTPANSKPSVKKRIHLPNNVQISPNPVGVAKSIAAPVRINLENKILTPTQPGLSAAAAAAPVTTPKRPGVAKRPLVPFFSPANVNSPAIPNSPKVVHSDLSSSQQQTQAVKRSLIDAPLSGASPSKRGKEDCVVVL